MEPEGRLWRAVIGQALDDATSTASTRSMTRERDRARSWLTEASADFKHACDGAGWGWQYVAGKMNGIAATGWVRPAVFGEQK